MKTLIAAAALALSFTAALAQASPCQAELNRLGRLEKVSCQGVAPSALNVCVDMTAGERIAAVRDCSEAPKGVQSYRVKTDAEGQVLGLQN